jgi:hypothetical protein
MLTKLIFHLFFSTKDRSNSMTDKTGSAPTGRKKKWSIFFWG